MAGFSNYSLTVLSLWVLRRVRNKPIAPKNKRLAICVAKGQSKAGRPVLVSPSPEEAPDYYVDFDDEF